MQDNNITPGIYRVIPSGAVFMVQRAAVTGVWVRQRYGIFFNRTVLVEQTTWRTVADGDRPAIFQTRELADVFVARVTGPFLNYSFR